MIPAATERKLYRFCIAYTMKIWVAYYGAVAAAYSIQG